MVLSLFGLVRAVRQVHASEAVQHYLVALVEATRRHGDLRLGGSPRASLHLLRAARAHAALAGRDHVLPDDVQLLATPVLAHRLLLTVARKNTAKSASRVIFITCNGKMLYCAIAPFMPFDGQQPIRRDCIKYKHCFFANG